MLLVTGITGHSSKYFLQELIEHKYSGPLRCTVLNDYEKAILANTGLDIEIAART